MNCPVCKNVNLLMSERQGIEIDYCPNCRGVWLDRGELDKLIEKASASAPQPQAPPVQQGNYRPDPYRSDSYQHGKHRKKREGFLGDLFDF